MTEPARSYFHVEIGDLRVKFLGPPDYVRACASAYWPVFQAKLAEVQDRAKLAAIRDGPELAAPEEEKPDPKEELRKLKPAERIRHWYGTLDHPAKRGWQQNHVLLSVYYETVVLEREFAMKAAIDSFLRLLGERPRAVSQVFANLRKTTMYLQKDTPRGSYRLTKAGVAWVESAFHI